MMHMVFYFGQSFQYLFSGWNVTTKGGLAGTMLAIFTLAAAYEGLKSFRQWLVTRKSGSYDLEGQEKSPLVRGYRSPKIGWRDHSIQTLLHLVQITVAYVLMLAFMTYNGWLCIALLLGSAFGYLVFAKSREEFADQSDCH
ncbi:high affinity copper uptake protein 1-like [Oscarella lobularis]|uniref:high affinity copper uptake protein 1-like n=1 Tax=Oscarella lobularis TaxID=121494 RepID=UPI00331387A1